MAIGYWDGAICDITPEGVVRAIRHAIDPSARTTWRWARTTTAAPGRCFDTSEIAVLTESMLRRGFTPAEIRAVMGGNSVRFLREQLPPT